MWCEEAGPSAIQGAITDGLTEVIGVSCKLLPSDGVDADPDQSLSMSWVSSNVSTHGLVGRISADPITLRKVDSESVTVHALSLWYPVESQKADSSCLRHEPLLIPLTTY